MCNYSLSIPQTRKCNLHTCICSRISDNKVIQGRVIYTCVHVLSSFTFLLKQKRELIWLFPLLWFAQGQNGSSNTNLYSMGPLSSSQNLFKQRYMNMYTIHKEQCSAYSLVTLAVKCRWKGMVIVLCVRVVVNFQKN